MTTYLGGGCSFGLPRVPFVGRGRFVCLVLRAGCGIWLYQFLIIAYLFTLLYLTEVFYTNGCPKISINYILMIGYLSANHAWPPGVLAGQVDTDAWTKKNDEKGFFLAGQSAALSSLKVRKKIAFSWKIVVFRHKPDIKSVNGGKNTNMWPLLNNSRECSVLMKKKIIAAVKRGTLLFVWKGTHWKWYQLEHNVYGAFRNLCWSIDWYQVGPASAPWGLTSEKKRTSVAWAPDQACLH